jgi:PmbA protein
MSDDALGLLEGLIDKAKRAGADAADALILESRALSHARRLGEVERIEGEESRDLGLRVLIGRRQANASSTDFGTAALDELVERAVSMAKNVPEDPYCGLAPAELLAGERPEIDICDPVEPDTQVLIDRARACEDAARAVAGVTNSEGAESSWGVSSVSLVASNGFSGHYARSGHSFATAVLAGEGQGMERDYDFASAVYGEDLEDPVAIGRQAGERAVRRLGARKPRTAALPVVFDPRVAGSLLGHLAGAINGAAVARGTSFLKGAMDQPVFAGGINVVDDPHRTRGLRSKPFDGEGVANRRRELVADGHLRSWVLDLAAARQLGLETTGHATRGTGGPPSPATTNLYMEPGAESPEALIGAIDEGFYVTELMGMGVNLITGDYSRGATGFWIEKGALTYPVSEATVAGSLKDMFAHTTPANDLAFKYGTNAPTLLVEGMTVAGN